MDKYEYIFRSEDKEFTAWVNPEHLESASACALDKLGAKFLEVVHKATNETELITIYRDKFIVFYPKSQTKSHLKNR